MEVLERINPLEVPTLLSIKVNQRPDSELILPIIKQWVLKYSAALSVFLIYLGVPEVTEALFLLTRELG